MSRWPLHEYDSSPPRRRLRRALLVLAEHLTREAGLYRLVGWLNARLSRESDR
jgi:hypothetical protein